MDRYIVVSSDGHAGPPAELYRDYLDPEFRSRFDEHQETDGRAAGPRWRPRARSEFEEEWEEETGGDGGLTAGYDSAARNRILDTEGVVAEVLFPDADVLGTGRLASSPFGTGLAAGSQSDPGRRRRRQPRPQPLALRLRQGGARPAASASRSSPRSSPTWTSCSTLVREAKDLGHTGILIPTRWFDRPAYHEPALRPAVRARRGAGPRAPHPLGRRARPTTGWATGCSRSTRARPAGGPPARCTS